MDIQKLTLDVDQQIDIQAAVDDVFEGMLKRLSDQNTTPPDDKPMPMCLERWPGGRWYRDTGNDTGHLWGFVQVIKPPKLLELCGPMFMSYPVAGHLSIRVTDKGGITRLSLRHRALGFLEEEHCQGVKQGWQYYINGVKRDCES